MELNETIYRMHNKLIYSCTDEQIAKEQMESLDKLFEYNQLPPSQQSK